jgi:hypothetical protein
LAELHLENEAYRVMTSHDIPFTHHKLHTLSLTMSALRWVIGAFTAGYRFPQMSRLVLTDIGGLNSTTYSENLHSISDQLSLLTHIEVQAASAWVGASPSPLFLALTGLHTLTLVGSAVEPMLWMLTFSGPKRVQELRLSDSDTSGTMLRDYLAAIEKRGGGTSGVQVVWNNCPNFSGEYGGALGELHL